MDNWYVYIIDKKGKPYVGITTDMENRMRQHGMEKPSYKEGPLEKHTAADRERQIKKWTRMKKEKLIQLGQESQGEFTLSEVEGSPSRGANHECNPFPNRLLNE